MKKLNESEWRSQKTSLEQEMLTLQMQKIQNSGNLQLVSLIDGRLEVIESTISELNAMLNAASNEGEEKNNE